MAKKKKNKPPQCRNCTFSRNIEKPSFLDPAVECHRYPPQQDETTKRPGPSPFPIMKPEEWCGEHKPKPKQEKTNAEND